MKIRHIYLSLILLVSLLSPSFAEVRQPRILVIGDSLMSWNKGRAHSVADVVGAELGEPVRNKSVGGARFSRSPTLIGALGMHVSNQFIPGPWDWVVISGGGNDLLLGCKCSRCNATMTQLVSRDGTYGVVPSTVRKIRKTGAKVLIVGYMRTPGFASPVEQCKDEGDIYDARLKTLARKTKGAYFISNANLVPFGDKTYHGADRIHPSKKGSKEIGKRIAALIRRKDRTRR